MKTPAKILLTAVTVMFFSLTSCGEGTAPRDSYIPPAPAGGEAADTPVTPLPEKAVMPELPLDPELPENDSLPAYVFGAPLAAGEAAEDSRFANCAFIGDSRTEGLQLFGGLKSGDYLWYRGPVIYAAADPRERVFQVGQERLSLTEALSRKRYDAVYIMSGVNELGNSAARFASALRSFIDLVEAAQPDAVIYLQTILPVNDDAARASGMKSFVTNRGVDGFNEVIVRLAAEKRVVLLDTAEVYRGADGQLSADMTRDGCHFKAGYYPLWADYLRTHVMEAERYHSARITASEQEGA